VIVQENYIKKATLYTPLLIVREILIHQLKSMKMIIKWLSVVSRGEAFGR